MIPAAIPANYAKHEILLIRAGFARFPCTVSFRPLVNVRTVCIDVEEAIVRLASVPLVCGM